MKNTCIKTFIFIYTATFHALALPIIEKETNKRKEIEHEVVWSSPKQILTKQSNPKLPNFAYVHKYSIRNTLKKVMKILRQIKMKINLINHKIDRNSQDPSV